MKPVLSIDKKVAATIGMLALLGVVTMLNATRFGIGVTPDSTVYLEAARNLSNGDGLVALTGTSNELKPLTHYPPLYPSLLALIASMGISVESAARWLNALLLGFNVILLGLSTRMFAPESFALPVLGAWLTLAAPDLLASHSFALSEPLFIFLTMIGLLCLATYVGSRNRTILLAAAGAIALSMLTRYVAIASLIAGTVALLSPNGRDVRRRLGDAMVFGAIACAPLGLWMIRNRLEAGGAADRQLVFHPVKLTKLISAASTVASWFMVGKVRGPIRPIVFGVEFVVVAVAVFFLLRSPRHDARSSPVLPHVLLLFIIAYGIFLIFTASFVDADTVLDHRSMAPVHVAVTVLGLWVGRTIYLRSQSRLLRVALAVVALAFATSYSLRGAKWLLAVRHDGQGYAARGWRDSDTISRIRSLRPDAPLYSNGYDSIYYLAGRRARYLPEKINPGTDLANANYELEIESMKNELKSHGGFLIFFNTFPERSFLPSESELRERLRLRLFAAESDGSIYMIED
jgi:hypothetical protein